MTTVSDLSAECERLRREPRSNEVTTAAKVLVRVDGEPPLIADYASAGLKIDLAKHHLDESIPGQQKERTEAAMRAMREGIQELNVWLVLNGYAP